MIAQPLFEQFSAASQKYKTGVLRVFGDDKVWEMILVDGRIVDVRRAEEQDNELFLQRLVKTCMLEDTEKKAIQRQNLSTEELEEYLVRELQIPQQHLQELRSHIATDALFEIGKLPELECEFFFHAVRDYVGPGMSVNFGQFLMDVVEFNVDEQRAQDIFRAMRRGRILALRGDIPERLLPFEQSVLSVIEFPCSFTELDMAPLTNYELIEGVLSLCDQGVLVLEGEESPEYKPRHEVRRKTRTFRLDEIKAAMGVSGEMPSVMPVAAAPSVVPEPAGYTQRGSGGKYNHQATLSDRLLALNYQALEEKQLQKVILYTNELFLLAVLLSCLMGPQILDTWFQGLSDFTSALVATHGTEK